MFGYSIVAGKCPVNAVCINTLPWQGICDPSVSGSLPLGTVTTHCPCLPVALVMQDLTDLHVAFRMASRITRTQRDLAGIQQCTSRLHDSFYSIALFTLISSPAFAHHCYRTGDMSPRAFHCVISTCHGDFLQPCPLYLLLSLPQTHVMSGRTL